MNPESRPIAGNLKVFQAFSYTLVFLMLMCVVMTIDSLIQIALPDWSAGFIAGVALFIVLDRLFMHARLKALIPLSSEWTITLFTRAGTAGSEPRRDGASEDCAQWMQDHADPGRCRRSGPAHRGR